MDTQVIALWAMGLLNNMPFVIMLACAKSISDGGTAIVFLASNIPGLLMKLSSPYWFDKVGYNTRMKMASILMSCGFLLVAYFGSLELKRKDQEQQEYDYDHDDVNSSNGEDEGGGGGGLGFNVAMQLVGVAMCSAQGDMGEASLLALSGRVDSYIEQLQKAALNNTNIEDDDNDEEQITGPQSGSNSADEAQQQEQKSHSITAFSSGTGLAGPGGFAFVVLFHDLLQLSLPKTLTLALIFPLLYWGVYKKYLSEATMSSTQLTTTSVSQREGGNGGEGDYGILGEGGGVVTAIDNDMVQRGSERHLNSVEIESSYHGTFDDDNFMENPTVRGGNDIDNENIHGSPFSITDADDEDFQSFNDSNNNNGTDNNTDDESIPPVGDIKVLGAKERLRLVLSLWPYMVPLFTVYAAEYALQSGVWTAIGFPVYEKDARNAFYVRANWAYQVGVFISRSSGTLLPAPMWLLWLMPILQCINLILFYFDAVHQVWYNYTLLIPWCFYVGLLGGGVYVNGYTRMNKDLPLSIREFALASASVADSFGVLFADLSGLFIQSCLYKAHGIDGAMVTCPAS